MSWPIIHSSNCTISITRHPLDCLSLCLKFLAAASIVSQETAGSDKLSANMGATVKAVHKTSGPLLRNRIVSVSSPAIAGLPPG
jgi:hypothetical protein